MVFPGGMGLLVKMGIPDLPAPLGLLAPRDRHVGALYTPGGGRALAQKSKELKPSTPASLVEVNMVTKEAALTISACLQSRNTVKTLHTEVG
jgi:hypothetical protein